MLQKYYNVEVRIDSIDFINEVKKQEGTRVFTLDTQKYYYYLNETWVEESASTIEVCKTYILKFRQTGSNGLVWYTYPVSTLVYYDYVNWTRTGVGEYEGSIEFPLFPEGKTRFVYSGFTNDSKLIYVKRVNDSIIQMKQILLDGSPSDGITDFDLKIEVYDEYNFID